jgi:DNA-binding NarL/FixJ family response regulator
MVLTYPFGDDQAMITKLLIVDDSELIRNSLLGLLDGILDAECMRPVATLAQAIDVVRSGWPTLVALDLHLADGNAITHISQMKLLLPGIRIAVLTNDAHEFNRIRCVGEGAEWFFDKSTEFDKLLDVIRDLVSSNSMEAKSVGPHSSHGQVGDERKSA